MAIVTRLFEGFIFLILLVYLAGCPRDLEIYIYNNTGHDLKVDSDSGVGIWKTNEKIKLAQWTKEIEDKGRSLSVLRINEDSLLYEYRMNTLGDMTGMFGIAEDKSHDQLILQIDRDMRIYVIPPGQILPVENHFPQSEGFPVNPEK